jgi:hypothetical protein
MPIDARRVKPEDTLILTSGDSFSFGGPCSVRVVQLASLENGKRAVLIEVVAAPSDLASGDLAPGRRYWLVARGRDESLAFLDGDAVVSVHIAESTKHPDELRLASDLTVQAWGEVRRMPAQTRK